MSNSAQIVVPERGRGYSVRVSIQSKLRPTTTSITFDPNTSNMNNRPTRVQTEQQKRKKKERDRKYSSRKRLIQRLVKQYPLNKPTTIKTIQVEPNGGSIRIKSALQLTDDRGAQIIVKRNGCRKLEIIDKRDIVMSTPVLASHGGHQGAEYYPAIQLSLPSPKTNNKVPVSWGGVLGGRTDLIPLEQIQPMPKYRRNNSSNTPLSAESRTSNNNITLNEMFNNISSNIPFSKVCDNNIWQRNLTKTLRNIRPITCSIINIIEEISERRYMVRAIMKKNNTDNLLTDTTKIKQHSETVKKQRNKPQCMFSGCEKLVDITVHGSFCRRHGVKRPTCAFGCRRLALEGTPFCREHNFRYQLR